MRFERLRPLWAAAALLCAGVAGCGDRAPGEPTPLLAERLEAIAEAREAVAARARLHEEAPFTELGFVPADVEALVRVDLAALAARDPAAARMLDFLLRAQQPAAWEFLSAAGLAPGEQLRAIYLVVGPDARRRGVFLVAATGDVDPEPVAATLRRAGVAAEPGPGGALYLFLGEDAGRIGAHVPPPGTRVGESAVGVAPGLLVFGEPSLVRRSLAARAGQAPDVRTSSLARELAGVDGAASIWGAGRGGAEAWLAAVAPGLRKARFHALVEAQEVGELALRMEFHSREEAVAFERRLSEAIDAGVLMTAASPVGRSLGRLRDAARIEVEGKVLTAVARP